MANKIRAFVFFNLLLLSAVCSAQGGDQNIYHCRPCGSAHGEPWIRHFKDIPERSLYCLIRSFSTEECRRNAEHSEGANADLFQILLHDSAALIRLLEKYPALDNVYLYNEIQHPITDDIDVKKILAKVAVVNSRCSAKGKIMLALKITIGSNGHQYE